MLELTQEKLKQVVHYNPETGEFTWIITNKVGIKAGTTAGYINKKGYRCIKIDYELYLAHRLAFLYVEGKWPIQVDHINGDKSYNAWKNLRNCSLIQNLHNAKLSIKNTTGIKGLRYRDKRVKTPYYEAKVTCRGTSYTKVIKVYPDSNHETIKDTLASWLITTRESLHGEFTNHG